MTLPTELHEQADLTACQQFESTLLLAPRPLEDFLPAEDRPDYLPTLCRLIVLEMEHRWRLFQQQQRTPQPGQTVDFPAGIEAYLRRFPKLKGVSEAVRLLLQEEYKLRHRFGDQPEASEYQARYSLWVDSKTPFAPPAAPSTTARSVPGYTIISELGRGGMGVVYRAQQTSLKRVVALKMILADRHAAPETLARFHAEAEAVAHLRHPNIVQIYDVNEHDGIPYFAMEFVPGGSLSKRLQGKPLAPMAAARLVEALARAMHHAHERGVIHRDLKPANVLLEEAADGLFPKITDFGLAKRLDGDSGQTHTGAVMGTPSYMAPEQAAGRIHEIGPLTDVYALGAILYETLTGRPPFKAETSLLTMQQVIHEDVPPPSRWHKVSPDLETICLKALSKERSARYASALDLAEDLARFQSGEPIRARRESLLARAGRKLRRHRAVAAMAAMALVAVFVITYFVLKDTKSTQIAAVVREVEAALQERDWPDDRLAVLEARLAELAELDPTQADALRSQLVPRYAEVLRDSFASRRRPILAADELPAFEARFDALTQRDAKLGQAVRAEFQSRLRNLQEELVKAPFEKLATVFDPAQVLIQGDTLRAQPGLDVLPTKLSCLGKVEFDVYFDAAWQKTGRIGLALNWQPGSEYLFLFGVPDRVDPNGGDPQPPLATDTMAAHKGGDSELSLMIFRNGDKLRETRVLAKNVLGVPQLHLHASRDGDRLLFQVNELAPAIYLDSFPLTSAAPGVFALRVPGAVGIERLRFANQVLPPQPSPLERGDDLYTRGKFGEALNEYRRQELPAATTELGQELRYKIANCLFRLQRPGEAGPLFEEVAAVKGQRWPPLAAMHLWLVYLQQNQLDQVSTILLDLSRQYTVDHLASLMPVEVRQHLLTAYTVQTLGAKFVRHDPLRVKKLERVVELTDMFRARDYDRLHLRISLLRAYHFAGQFDEAIQLAEDMLKDPSLAGSWPESPHRLLHWQIRTLEEYAWLMRLRGDPQKAIAAIDLRLFSSPGKVREPYRHLLVERARLHAFLKNGKQAEADLAQYLGTTSFDQHEYRYAAEGHLLLGMLRHDQGDVKGAKAAWEGGLHRNWIARWRAAHPNEPEGTRLIYAGTVMITNMALAALTDNVTEQETQDLANEAVNVALGNVSAAGFKHLLRLTPAVLQDLWQTPRGLEVTRRMALRDVAWNRYQSLPTILIGVAFLRQGALPDKVSADQDALSWKVGEDLQDAYFATGKITKDQIFSLATTWTGVLGQFGWNRVRASVPEHLRGPLAYMFGQRYALRLHKPDDARSFFQQALDDAQRAPVNPILERAARMELANLPGKK